MLKLLHIPTSKLYSIAASEEYYIYFSEKKAKFYIKKMKRNKYIYTICNNEYLLILSENEEPCYYCKEITFNELITEYDIIEVQN